MCKLSTDHVGRVGLFHELTFTSKNGRVGVWITRVSGSGLAYRGTARVIGLGFGLGLAIGVLYGVCDSGNIGL